MCKPKGFQSSTARRPLNSRWLFLLRLLHGYLPRGGRFFHFEHSGSSIVEGNNSSLVVFTNDRIHLHIPDRRPGESFLACYDVRALVNVHPVGDNAPGVFVSPSFTIFPALMAQMRVQGTVRLFVLPDVLTVAAR